jgi:squalene-hopene/tetraprenyl-beta-curcumene cyclase
LFDLQNNDGGMPTFCHGWGALPFDRSTPEITAHTLWAWSLWSRFLSYKLWDEWSFSAVDEALRYLDKRRAHLPGGSAWEPLWFGNEHAPGEMNYVYGTAQTLHGLVLSGVESTVPMVAESYAWLMKQQHPNGGWGGAAAAEASIEETAVTIQALALLSSKEAQTAIERGVVWLMNATKAGTVFQATPIGLYFARLWYHEQLYPVIWTLGALKAAKRVTQDQV